MSTDNANRFEKVFYLASHGMMGDHWFDWVPKALNSHPQILIFFGETVRAKYLKERSRKDRPDVAAYTEYLSDVGSPAYQAVGECFCYRAYQLESLKEEGIDVPWANLVRHPYPWLNFHVQWRTSNMNMPLDITSGIDHEWNVTWHDFFAELPLKRYKKEDVHIWSAYQGMTILNRMVSDRHEGVKNIPLENLVSDQQEFTDLVKYLTRSRVEFSPEHLDLIFSWVNTPWRKNSGPLTDPKAIYEAWPEWQKEAFEIIVSDESKEMFKGFDYEL